MAKVQRRVRFYEVRAEDGSRVAEVADLERNYFNVVASLDQTAKEHWQGDSGVRVLGRVFRADGKAPKPRTDLVIIDKVHREPPFSYVKSGEYTDHQFSDEDTQFAEPKFLAFFERNVVATFSPGLRMNVVEAALSTWRVAAGLPPISLVPIVDTERLLKLAEAGAVDKFEIQLPADVAREVYAEHNTTLGTFMRSRAVRGGMIGVTLQVDVGDPAATEELLAELRFLVQDDETYAAVAAGDRAEVKATYYAEEGGRPRSHSFLGQELAMSVSVEIAEPERGPQPHVASEALMHAHTRKRDALHNVLGPG